MSDIYKKKIMIGDAVTIKFSMKHSDEDTPDIDEMTVEELEEKIARLDAIEPADEESDEYDDQADQHEDLEDLLDEVEDRLDEISE